MPLNKEEAKQFEEAIRHTVAEEIKGAKEINHEHEEAKVNYAYCLRCRWNQNTYTEGIFFNIKQCPKCGSFLLHKVNFGLYANIIGDMGDGDFIGSH